MLKKLLLLLCVPLIYGTALTTASAQQNQSGNVEETNYLRLKGIDGQTYDLTQMRGKVLLVSFGATWCQPCDEELHTLEQLKKEYQKRPVTFLWVSIEREDEISADRLRAFAKSHKLTFPVLRDPYKWAFMQFSERVRLPMIVFFDKEGKVDAPKQVGYSVGNPDLYKTRIRARLDKLLAAPGAANPAGGR